MVGVERTEGPVGGKAGLGRPRSRFGGRGVQLSPGSEPQNQPFDRFATANPPELPVQLPSQLLRIPVVVLVGILVQSCLQNILYGGPVKHLHELQGQPQRKGGWIVAQSLPAQSSPALPDNTPQNVIDQNEDDEQKRQSPGEVAPGIGVIDMHMHPFSDRGQNFANDGSGTRQPKLQ